MRKHIDTSNSVQPSPLVLKRQREQHGGREGVGELQAQTEEGGHC